MTFRVRVQKAGGQWRWRCRNKHGWVHDLDHAPTHTEALTAGLAHLDIWHNDKDKP